MEDNITKAKDTKVFYVLYKNTDSNFDVVSFAIHDTANHAKILANWQKQNNAKIVLWRGWYQDCDTQKEFNYYLNNYKQILIDEMLKQVKTYRIGNTINYWDSRKKHFVKIDVSLFSIFSQFVTV
jgi:hypothetical protein